MKMMKAMKKLKFWSKKKRKKTRKVLNEVESLNPPPHCYCSPSVAEPSAPPLPPWLELHWEAQPLPKFQDQISHKYQPSLPETFSRPPYVYQQYGAPDHSAEPADGTGDQDPDPVIVHVPFPDPVPVLVPVMAATAMAVVQRKKSAGLLGCVFNFSAHIFHCFFPCFRIREETFPLLLPASSHT